MPLMDIHTGFIVTAILVLLFAVLSARNGLRAIRSARKMTFYRLRRQREAGGWRMLGLALVLAVLAFWLPFFGEPIAYEFFPPTPTPSPTPTITIVPTITLTSTITLTPTITDTPLVTDTPTATSTPFVPLSVLALFQSSVTPNPTPASISPLQFSTRMDNAQAVNPQTVFENPVGHMFGVFTYNGFTIGSQWTALWLHDGKVVHYQTQPWEGPGVGIGGYGFTDWYPSPDKWLPGIYEVQLFIGQDWIGSGRFVVQGDPPTLTPTVSPTVTRTTTPSRTPSPSSTPSPTGSPQP